MSYRNIINEHILYLHERGYSILVIQNIIHYKFGELWDTEEIEDIMKEAK